MKVRRGWFGLMIALGAPAPALAAAVYSFNIAPQPTRQALIEATVTANGSLGGDLVQCGGRSPGFQGRAPLAVALKALLSETGCSFRIAGDNAIVIVRAPARPGPARRPAVQTPTRPPDSIEVTVVARRRVDEDITLGLQRSNVQGEHLNAEGVLTIADLAPQVVGMVATNLGPGRNKVLLRGLSDGVFPGEASATVALFFDDAPLNYVEKDPSLRLIDIDSVDVVRAPQARAPNAIGGAIYIRPTRPLLDQFAGSGSIEGKTISRGGTGYAAGATLNLPLVKDRDALRLVAYSDEEPGYIEDRLPTGVVTNGSHEVGLRAQNAWVSENGWRLDSTLIVQRLKVDDSQYVFAPLADFTRSNRLAEPSSNNVAYLISTLSGTVMGAKARWTLSYSDHDLYGRYDATQTLGVFGLSTANPAAYDARNHLKTFVNSVGLKGGDRHASWRAGGSLVVEQDQESSVLGLVSTPGAPLYQDTRRDSRFDASGYLGATLQLLDRLDIDLSLSPYHWSQSVKADAVRADGSVVGAPYTTKLDHLGVQPAASLIYTPIDDLELSARVSAAERPRGVNTGVLLAKRPSGATPFQANRTYTGDRLQTYELGQSYISWRGALSVKLTEYIMNWRQVQADEFSIYNTPITVNLGNGELTGIEAEVGVKPGHGFAIKALAGAEHAALGGQVNKAFFSGSYGGLIGAPRYTGGLIIDRHGETSGIKWRWSALYALQGPSRATFDGLTASNLRGYDTVNLSVEFSYDGWSLLANATNLFDQRGDTLAFGNPFSVQRGRQITPQRPRLISVGIERRF